MRIQRSVVAGAGAAVLVLAGWCGLGPDAPGVDPDSLALEARATALEARVALARSDSLHLVLEPDRGTLTLNRGGAPLTAWPVRDVVTGKRRFARAEPGWHLLPYPGGAMTPPVRRERKEIVSDQVEPPDLTGAETEIPPTPEEAVPAPGRFVIRFQGGLGLEVVSEGDLTGPGFPFLRSVGHTLWRLLPGSRDRLRIRIRMDGEDAGALYRSFPEGSAFIAVPG